MIPPSPATRRGFTLIEALASIVILSIIGLTSSRIILIAATGYADASDRAALYGDLSIAIDRIARELRSINIETSSNGPVIDSVTASSLAWSGDYSLGVNASNELVLQLAGDSETLLDGVTSLTIETFDDAGNVLAATLDADSADDVRLVRVTIGADRGGASGVMRTAVFIRSTSALMGG